MPAASTNHFYYGDETGKPGTILTFFTREHVVAGQSGLGQTQQTAFRVPFSSLSFWARRLVEEGVTYNALETHFYEWTLSFADPDGTALVLVGSADTSEAGWITPNISAEHAIRGVHSVTLVVEIHELILRFASSHTKEKAPNVSGAIAEFGVHPPVLSSHLILGQKSRSSAKPSFLTCIFKPSQTGKDHEEA